MSSKEEIEENSVSEGLLLRRNGSNGGGSSGSLRWVDGSEVNDNQEEVYDKNEEIIRENNYGSVRRRLKKPKRVDSLDVESMQIKGGNGGSQHIKVNRQHKEFLSFDMSLIML